MDEVRHAEAICKKRKHHESTQHDLAPPCMFEQEGAVVSLSAHWVDYIVG
jgi:hypothetical protein